LDAGDPGQVWIGGRHAYVYKSVWSAPDNSLSSFYYVQDPFYVDAISGEIAEFAWPGGADIGPFEASTVVLQEPRFTSPIIAPATAIDIDFNSDLELRWDSEGTGDYVYIMVLNSNAQFQTDGCLCMMEDDGAFSVPSYYLQAVKLDLPFTTMVVAGRQKIDVSSVPLVGGGSAPLYVLSEASVWASGTTTEK
jgi:hypothetical protein